MCNVYILPLRKHKTYPLWIRFSYCTFREIITMFSVKELKISTLQMESFSFKVVDIHEYHSQLKI